MIYRTRIRNESGPRFDCFPREISRIRSHESITQTINLHKHAAAHGCAGSIQNSNVAAEAIPPHAAGESVGD
jgi:hypothetical protein